MSYPTHTAKMIRGFTLIEVLVVIAVLGIVAALAMPAFNDAIARNGVVARNNELLAGLALARTEAIRANAPASLCAANAAQTACQATWGADWLAWIDRDADGVVDAGEEVLQVGGVTDREAFSSPSGAAHTLIRFNPRGLRTFPAAIDVRLQVSAVSCPSGQDYRRTIVVTPTGATRSAAAPC
ncbi:MAG: GspH/FimT family pseudopilin [Pseudomarimonas sp.]